MIMPGAVLQTVIGLAAIGIPAAGFCVRYIESQLYESKGISLGVIGGRRKQSKMNLHWPAFTSTVSAFRVSGNQTNQVDSSRIYFNR